MEVARSHRPHLVMVDLLMPVVDGWSLLERLREEPAGRDAPWSVANRYRKLLSPGGRRSGRRMVLNFGLEAARGTVQPSS